MNIMKVLVTGGAGFIGSYIVEQLLRESYEVVIVDNLSTGDQSRVPKDISFYLINIESPELDAVFAKEKPDIVIHAAAQNDVATSLQHPVRDGEINILGTINILMNCHKYNVEKIIYSSSCAVYGDAPDKSIKELDEIAPFSFYGISKYVSELYIRVFYSLYGLKYTILRYANVYGPRQNTTGEGGVIAIFCNKLLKDERPVIYGLGQQTRDFIFVEDVASANIKAMTHGDQETLNISCNDKTSISELYGLLLSFFPTNPIPHYQEQRKGDILYSRLDNSKAKQLLNWCPNFSLRAGLAKTVNYYRHQLSGE